jgi:hypothetical protein
MQMTIHGMLNVKQALAPRICGDNSTGRGLGAENCPGQVI